MDSNFLHRRDKVKLNIRGGSAIGQ